MLAIDLSVNEAPVVWTFGIYITGAFNVLRDRHTAFFLGSIPGRSY